VTAANGKGSAISLPISIRNVTKTYGTFTALDSVDLEIASGEFITLLGPSGSGKTTLLMVLAGFIRPASGEVRFGDRDVSLLPPHKRDVGMVFQNYALFPHMTVAGNVGYPLRLRGVAKTEIADRVQKVLGLVQLGELGARNIDQLSGGQRQRVALARAIVFEPRILLMDEPLSALDKKLREEMQIEVRHLHQRLGMTTVYVTHDQREALTMSDRVAVIDKGRFHQIGSPRDVYERPESRFIAEFIGESHLVAVSMRGGTAHYRDRPLQLAEPPRHASGQQFLVMRPEKLKLLTGGEDGLNVFEGTAREIVYQGESTLLYVDLPDDVEVAIRQPATSVGPALPAPGTPVRLGLPAGDTMLVPAERAP
jgi:putative spermidine/putrescine transport system ATP-binding protein